MLILAGVSINAIVGDNGILGKAQEATFLQSIAVLEEYMNMVYAEHIEEASEYQTPKDYFWSNYPNWFYRNQQGYVSDAYGHALYLLNMEGIYETNPTLKSQIKGGTASTAKDFYGQKDVYGITSDLKVFYCANGVDSILGLVAEDLDADNPLEEAYDKDSALSKLIKGEDSDRGLSYQDLKSIKILTIAKEEDVLIIKEIEKLPNLNQITIQDVTVNDLSGIEKGNKLEIINIKNCTVGSYSALANCSNLVSLYLINQSNEEAQKFMTDFASSTITTLKYLGMYATSSTYRVINDISKLANWQDGPKQSIEYMYLYTESLQSINSLNGFTALKYIDVNNNNLLNSLAGVENLPELTTLYAYSCALTGLPAFATNSNLNFLSVYSNSGIATLTGINNCNDLATLYAYSCNITDVTALQGKTKLTYLDLHNNPALVNVATISSCTKIGELYLSSNNNMSTDDVTTLGTIIANCGKKYSIPDKYMEYLKNLTSYDYTNKNLSDNSALFNNLKGKTQIYRLSLAGNTNLGKSKIGNMIKGKYMTVAELATIKSNLTLSTAEKSIIDTYQAYTDAQIEAMSETQINAIESEDNDLYLRYVLSTMTGLQYVSLKNLSNLSSIDFVNKVTGLIGLDLYGTGATDLSILETNALSLGELRINNQDIDLTKIQKTISNLKNSKNFFGPGYAGSEGFETVGAGFLCYGDELLSKLKDCKDITRLYMWSHGGSMCSKGYTLDLSGCESLKEFTMCRYINGTVLLSPETTTATLEDVNYFNVDFSCASSLKELKMNACVYNHDDLDNLANNLSFYDSINSIQIRFYSSNADGTYKDWLKKFENCTNLEIFNVFPYEGSNFTAQYGDLSDIVMPSSLKALNIQHMGITKMPDLSKCKSLYKLAINKNPSITDLDFCKGLSNLEMIYADDCKISSIIGIKNLTKLKSISLQNNYLYNNSYYVEDGKTKGINNCSIFAELYSKELRSLWIEGNYIDDTTAIDELDWTSWNGFNNGTGIPDDVPDDHSQIK
ncbi:MAG: hypothetical protein J6A36_02615 [Clostridia bacterium]|nr:hypothetical protein [Clostridia bacterium]